MRAAAGFASLASLASFASLVTRVAVAALVMSACGGSPSAPVAPSPKVAGAPSAQADADEPHGTFTRGPGGVDTYVSIPWGFSTRSYVLEGPGGLVAIDTQFLPSAAEEMIQLAEAATHKKFVLAVVLHANPDKFNGTATFQRHGVKVVTSSQVKALLPAIHEKRMRSFYERYQPDYPSDVAQPDAFGDKTTELSAAGLTLKLLVMGAGCSESHVVVEHGVEHEKGLFVGDLVASQSHSWLEIGKTDEWLKRIAELEQRHPKRVYPGRGPEGDATKLLGDEKAYLNKAILLVGAEKPTMPVRPDALARVEQGMIAAYPSYEFPVFLKIGLPAEWERQALAAKK
ncbi:MAG: beta-lactamase [Myxococcaceae bacterium]|nr:beta-lactamase [Myxococcaceae bacterium]